MKAKKSNREVNVPILLLGVAFIVIGCSLGITSFAWFYVPTSTAQVKDIRGKAVGNYFDGGDGTASNPYGISTAKQLYYFNWLQDLGYFNQDKKNNETGDDADAGDGVIDKQYYFILKQDINASDYVLPPAGTKTYPFVGNFNGNGKTISNLRISNSWSDLTDHPTGAESTQVSGDIYMLKDAEIVGFFGIIGQYTNGSPTSSTDDETSTTTVTGSVNCKTKTSSTTSTYTIRSVSGTGDSQTTTYINSVDNLYFDNLEVSTVANATLAGLLAGYVNGNMKYCGVRSGYFDFGSTVSSALQDDVVGTSNSLLSKYSIIGDYSSSKNFNWTGKPKSTSGSTWGDSVDIYTVSKRLDSIYHHSTKGGSGYSTLYTSDSYHLNGGVSASNGNEYDHTGTTVSAMLLSGTYLPLSVTSNPDNYADNGSETVAETNGGYIVGGGSSQYASSSYVRVRNVVEPATAKTYVALTNGIMNSVSGINSSGDPLSASNFSFLYYDSVNKKHYRIRDDDNKGADFKMTKVTSGSNYTNADIETDTKGTKTSFSFNNYSNVKTNLISTLNAVTTELKQSGSLVLPGMMLIDEATTESYTATGGVKIAGKEYTSYEFYKGGINFTLKEDGYVSIVLGTYITNYYQCPNFYKFYELTRSESGNTSTIADVKEIKRISGSFKDNNLSYEYKDGTSEASFNQGKLSFDFSAFAGTDEGVLRPYAAYFVEIPLKKGSYFMAPDVSITTNKKNMPYILYFDIGENASGGSSSSSSETPDIDFVYYKDATAEKKEILPISDGNYKSSQVYFTISMGPTTVFYWRSDSESVVYYYVAPNTSSSSVTDVGQGKGSKDENDVYKSEFETSN